MQQSIYSKRSFSITFQVSCKFSIKNLLTLEEKKTLTLKIVKTFEFKCDECPQQFTNRTRFELHLRSHTGYECNVCGKTFKKKYHRTDHMRTHVCSINFVSFNVFNFLNKIFDFQTGERPYKCSLCEKNFTQRSALSGHLKWHAKLKLPRCSKKKKIW